MANDKIDPKRALQIFHTLIEMNLLRGIQAGGLQEDLSIDRRTVRRYLDLFVDAGIATQETKGITKVYTINIKLPGGKGSYSKEQKRAQAELECRAMQEKLRRTSSPDEPTWVILPTFYEQLAADPDLVKPADVYDAAVNYDWIAGKCRECKEIHICQSFDMQTWLCKVCHKAWMRESVFRTDSEDVST